MTLERGEANGVHVWVERRPGRFDYEVAIGVHMGGTQMRAAIDIGEDGEIVWDSIGTNETVPTFFRCKAEVLEAIVAAASDLKQPTPATQAHLEDAVAVRDRLLALVETGWAK